MRPHVADQREHHSMPEQEQPAHREHCRNRQVLFEDGAARQKLRHQIGEHSADGGRQHRAYDVKAIG